MIKHELKNDYLKIFYRNDDHPYSISIQELGDCSNWRVAESGDNKIVLKNVSRWTLHLLTDKNLSVDFAKYFTSLIKKYVPDNEINWERTEKAIKIYDEYRQMRSKIDIRDENGFSKLQDNYSKKTSDIISVLKRKYAIK